MASIGGRCVFASDIDEACRTVYEKNYGVTPNGDITVINEKDIPSHNVLCAGFPCQSFSKAGNRLGFSDETKGTLFFDVLRILKYHMPEYALLENVRNLATHDKGNTWRVIRDSLRDIGYNVPDSPTIFSPHNIGIPQHRERVFIMCVRKDIGQVPRIEIPDTECSIDSILLGDDEIDNIDKYRLTSEQIEYIDNWNEFLQGIKCDKLPGFPIWVDSLCQLSDNPYYSELGTIPKWKLNFVLKNNRLYLDNKEFIDKWLERAKGNRLFFGAKAKLEWQAGQTDKPNIWDNIMQLRPSGLRVKSANYFPALVAITQTSIVGKRKRFLTPRECARLQSFPDSFIIDENDREAYKQFGNSVNVEVVRLFAKSMLGS